jgi:hypothetical protein
MGSSWPVGMCNAPIPTTSAPRAGSGVAPPASGPLPLQPPGHAARARAHWGAPAGPNTACLRHLSRPHPPQRGPEPQPHAEAALAAVAGSATTPDIWIYLLDGLGGGWAIGFSQGSPSMGGWPRSQAPSVEIRDYTGVVIQTALGYPCLQPYIGFLHALTLNSSVSSTLTLPWGVCVVPCAAAVGFGHTAWMSASRRCSWSFSASQLFWKL